MPTLPIRRITLYKHGVGFFERRGAVDGAAVQITFRRDEINDVLKSLAVVDHAGGQVLGVYYETPADKPARLADSSIVLSDEHSLLDLLRALRGRPVALGLVEGERRGLLVGADVDPQAPLEKSMVALLETVDAALLADDAAADDAAAGAAPGATVVMLPVSALRRITLLDERAAHDLRFFLDTALSEDVRRALTVRLSPGAHDLSAFYIAPSPTWRVSYRVIAERAGHGAQRGDGGDGRAEGGRLVLQGWGLFDNRLDEDLEDVEVTLVAGMPISFVYDLASSRIPARPVVQDESRIAPGPVEYDEALGEAMREFAPAPAMVAADAPAGRHARARAALSLDDAAAAPAQAQGTELGELFEYAVTAPVSVRRGDSALVPILSARLDYRRELLYNGHKLRDHPVVAARFQNASGLTLERGPVTVIEDGNYRGEAVVPFSKAGAEVYLAYAVELGVRVSERSWHSTHVAGLHLQGAYLVIEEWLSAHTAYTLANSTAEDLVVTIEKPRLTGYELADTRASDAETAEHRRWRVKCPARGATEFTVRERTRRSRHEQILDQTYDQLRRYLQERWLDEATFQRLKALLDERAAIQRNQQELQALQAERTELYARQEQLRKNMEVMGREGEEGQLRRRLREQLAQSEDRLAAIDQRVVELKADIERRERAIKEAMPSA